MMTEEFRRFGLTDLQRKLTGVLQLFGAAGMLTGLISPIVGFLSACGFTAMMFMAFIVRIKIKDSVAQSVPSLLFMLMNAWLALMFYNLL